MDPKTQVLARIAELDAKHAEIKGKRSALVDTAIAEKRGLSDEQKVEFDGLDGALKAVDVQRSMSQARLAELEADDAREARAADVRVAPAVGGAKTEEPAIYRADNAHEFSYFRDLYKAQLRGDYRAAERLSRNTEIEKRSPLSTTAGAGGEFAPPQWLVSEYVKLARASRVAIDLFDGQPLPSGISSINLPKVSTGTAVAVQTENGAVLQTALTTGSLTTDITTVAGGQTVSLQLMEQSATPFDRVVLEDLAAAHAVELTRQAHAGNGTTELRGLTSAAGKVSVTLTLTTVAGFMLAIGNAINTVHTNRFLPADAILMHPRRWAWLTAQVDSTGRPLAGVRPAAEFNPLASGDANVALGFAGTIQNVPVYLDATIPTNLGGGTNQDRFYVLRRNDIKVWESGVQAEAFREVFADTMQVFFRLYNYSAMIPDRYGTAIVEVGGAGLVTPTW